MKHYAKFLLVGIVCAIFSICATTRFLSETTFASIVKSCAMFEVEYNPPYITVVTEWFIPLVLFQIFFGTYIYHHFCSASIYFFSRCCNRTKWFLKEVLILYIFCIAYLIIYVVSGTFITAIFIPVEIDAAAVTLFVYYIVIYSLFLLLITLAVNILAIIFTSNVAFVIVEMITFFFIGAYTMMGNTFVVSDDLLEKYLWLFKCNPFSHLVFNMHSSRIENVNKLINIRNIEFDLNESVLLFLIFVIILTGIGCVVVNYHNFMESNKETGGI